MVSSSRTMAPVDSWGAADLSAATDGNVSGSVTRLMRYWKPWQPPLSTCMRRARKGLASLAITSERRCEVGESNSNRATQRSGHVPEAGLSSLVMYVSAYLGRPRGDLENHILSIFILLWVVYGLGRLPWRCCRKSSALPELALSALDNQWLAPSPCAPVAICAESPCLRSWVPSWDGSLWEEELEAVVMAPCPLLSG